MITYKKRTYGSYDVFFNEEKVGEIDSLKKTMYGSRFRFKLNKIFWASELPSTAGSPYKLTPTLKDALHEMDAILSQEGLRDLYMKAINDMRIQYQEAIDNFESSAERITEKKEPEPKEGTSRAGSKWTEAEELNLTGQFKAGVSIYNLCKLHDRNAGGIIARLQKLHLIDIGSDVSEKLMNQAKAEANAEIERIKEQAGI